MDIFITPHPEVVAAPVGDEIVLLHAETGVYYSLNAVAARLWVLWQGGASVASACASVAEECGVSSSQVEADAAALIEALDAQGLIRRR